MQRILAITLAANVFFLLRVIIEVSGSVASKCSFNLDSLILILIFCTYLLAFKVCIGSTLIIHFLSSKSLGLVASHSLWSKCILAKHWAEVCILALELIVSTSVSSPHSRRGSSHARRGAAGTSESKRR